MFYDLLLFRQNEGRLNVAWLAATRGIKHLDKSNKTKVNETNIEKLCDDVAKYVCSTSSSPKQRFSLRLASVLINGVVKIYHQQATQFLSLIVENLTIVKIPSTLSLFPDETSVSKTHIVKIKAKKPRRKIDAQQIVDSPLEDLLAKIQSQEVFTPEELNKVGKTINTAQLIQGANITLVGVHRPLVNNEEEMNRFGMVNERELQQLLGSAVDRIDQTMDTAPSVKPSDIPRTETHRPMEIVTEGEVGGLGATNERELKQLSRVEETHRPLTNEEQEFDRLGVIDERELQELLGVTPFALPQQIPPVPVTQISKPPSIQIHAPEQPNVITIQAEVHRPMEIVTEEEVGGLRATNERELKQLSRVEETHRPLTNEEQEFDRLGVIDERELQELLGVAPFALPQQILPVPVTQKSTPDTPSILTHAPEQPNILTVQPVVGEFTEVFPNPKCRLQIKPKRTIAINRTEKYEFPTVKPERIIVPKLKIKYLNSTILSDRYPIQETSEQYSDKAVEVSISKRGKRESSVSISEAAAQKQQNAQEHVDIQQLPVVEKTQSRLPSILEPIREISETPLQSERQSNQRSSSTPLAKKARPTQEIRLTGTIEETLELIGQHLQSDIPIPSLHPAEPTDTEKTEIRHQTIVEKVLAAGRPLIIDDVCPEPINRGNIASTFSDLLVLCKAGYVALEGNQSCELTFIRKGRKFDRHL